jgi:hypothetical protein
VLICKELRGGKSGDGDEQSTPKLTEYDFDYQQLFPQDSTISEVHSSWCFSPTLKKKRDFSILLEKKEKAGGVAQWWLRYLTCAGP